MDQDSKLLGKRSDDSNNNVKFYTTKIDDINE